VDGRRWQPFQAAKEEEFKSLIPILEPDPIVDKFQTQRLSNRSKRTPETVRVSSESAKRAVCHSVGIRDRDQAA
jgi:hypothetical protein